MPIMEVLMNQVRTYSKIRLFYFIFSFGIFISASTKLFAMPVDSSKVDQILTMLTQQSYSEVDFRDTLITKLNATKDNKKKAELLIQLCAYNLFMDQYENVDKYSNQLNILSKKSNNISAIEISKVYLIIGKVKLHDPANLANEKLQELLPTLTDERAKIHYSIALAMAAIRENFPVLEIQLLRNTLQKTREQSNYFFEELAILLALSATSKDVNEYVELTIQAIRLSNKHQFPLNISSLLYNLAWHLSLVNELNSASKVADQLLNIAKITLDKELKPILLVGYIDAKTRNKESISPDTLSYIKSIKPDGEFWQAWLNTIISLYYATENNEKEALIYLNFAKQYFNNQPDLETPDEFIEIESLLAFNNQDYLTARTLSEKFWWKKYLSITNNQQNNLIIVRNTLQKVIIEEKRNRLITEQLLLKYERASVTLAVVLFVIFILLIFKYRMYLKIKHEIKMRIQAETDLRKAKIKAEEASQSKSVFLSNMSHEIRTPMNGVLGSLQVLKQNELPHSSQELVDIGITSSKNLLSLINDILDLSKIQSNNISIESLPTDIPKLIESIVAELRFLAEEKNVDLTFTMKDKEHPNWLADPLRLRQIIFNLISNAIKFTPNGLVSIIVKEIEEKLLIEGEDSGIGIAQSQLENLFNRYEQADSTTTRKFGGTGLGLSISKELTQLMGGKISVTSKESVGSTFSVMLPLKKTNITHPKKSGPLTTKAPQAEKLNILLAEDNKINQKIFNAIVKPTKAKIRIANDGLEAIEEVNKLTPDLIFMDIQMPNMDGIQACEMIKNTNPDIPIIALTANVMTHDIKTYKRVGFEHYLSKPIDLNEIYTLIQKYV